MAPLIRYPRIIAHRCGGALAPENSLAGLRIAKQLGCQGVEFDVMLSSDGVAMLIHDETLERTSTGQGLVADHTATQLAALDLGARHHKAFSPEPIPQFETALAELSRLGLWSNIEIKPASGHEAATGRCVAGLLKDRPPHHGIVSSFSRAALVAAREENPLLALALLYEQLPANWRSDAESLGASAVHLAARHVDAAVARELAGTTWACYTVNSQAEGSRLFALGAAAIFTDRPDLWP